MTETSRRHGLAVFMPFIVGIAAAAISVGRLLLTNPQTLSDVIWAEDGLFPLCALKVGGLSCITDPFAGYLLFVPRLVAAGVAQLPLADWPMATNVVAAALAGTIAALVMWILTREGFSLVASAFGALLPVLAPIVGLEAVNAIGSVYMLLMYLMAVALAFPRRGRGATVLYAVGMLVTALTIPSALVLLVPLGVQVFRDRISRRSGLILLLALVAGLVAQALVALSAPERRNVLPSWSSTSDWLNTIPTAVLTYWPGAGFGPTTIFAQFAVTPFPLTGAVIAVGIGAWAVWLIARRSESWPGIGALVLVGLVSGAVPTITGYASNRYYVTTVLLWGLAVLLAVDRKWADRRLVVPIIVTGLLVLWIPAYAASPWRSGIGLQWKWMDEVNAMTGYCVNDPNAVLDVHVTPYWPTPDVHLTEPTTARIPCRQIGLP